MLIALPLLGQSNRELTRLFEEDQKDRLNWQSLSAAELDTMYKRDTERRKRAAEMVRSGALKTGEDYEHAGYLFQHGAEPADYLMAHILAMTAEAIEPRRNPWLVTTTLDRYLHSIGKPQVFGTQLDSGVPFDKAFIPDSVRAANCVPSVADQARIVEAFAKKQPMPIVDPCGPKTESYVGKWSLTERMPDGTFTTALLFLSAPDSDDSDTLTENGKTVDISEVTLGGRNIRFQVEGREFRGVVDEGVMTGTFTLSNGGSGRFVGLAARGAKN